jgi:hypothetical protein
MDFYKKMVQNLDDVPVRQDGKYEPFLQYDMRPTYGVYFDEVYGTPLQPPSKPFAIPDSGCNRVFYSPDSNSVVPLVKQSGNVDFVGYDSPGPGVIRYASIAMNQKMNPTNPFMGYPKLPAIIRR